MSNISVKWIFVLCIFYFSQVDFMMGMVKYYVSTLTCILVFCSM